MRNIIFRGKRLDNGEWIYGGLLQSNKYELPCKCAYMPSPTLTGESFWKVLLDYEVDPATVGQYTGLQDKNGKKIFEGDILSDGAFTYEVRYKGTGFVTILDGHVYTMDTRPTKIVIGNIHDNPDLLK